MWITSPRIMILGAIPALVVGSVYTAAIVVFAFQLDAIAEWVTPFADGWSEPVRVATRFAAGLALIGVAVLLAIYTFVAVTLAVGDPFYERIWRTVETRMGDEPAEVDEPFWRSAVRGLGTAIRLLLLTALVGVALFATGLIPVLGPIAAPVLGAILGGWVIALELSGFAFDIRRFTLRERRRMLGARRAQTLGFGVLTYVLFLVPFGAVVIMPAAVAGATMLARDAIGAGEGRADPPGYTANRRERPAGGSVG